MIGTLVLARVRRVLLLGGLVFAALPVGLALASTTIGQAGASAGSDGQCGTGVFADTTYVVPSGGGVIRRFSVSSSAASAGDQRDFLVLRGSGANYTVVGKTGLVTLLGIGVQTIPVNIAVQSGDLLGVFVAGARFAFHQECGRRVASGGGLISGTTCSPIPCDQSDPNVGDTLPPLRFPTPDTTFNLNESAVLGLATPSIGTSQQPATATVGSSIADQATVSGGDNPSGTVTFNLYDNPNGTGTPLFTDTESLVNGVATSAGYTATATGTDYWVATYNGDSNNDSVSSGVADEAVTVIKASPTIGTTQQPASAAIGSSIADKASLTGLGNPSSADTVTFKLYSSATTQDSTTLLFSDTETVTLGTGGTATATSAGYTASTSRTDYWVASFSGDTNNNSAPSGAASEPVAITITKTGSSGGSLTVKPGQVVIISPNATIGGGVTVQAGGSLEIDGGAKINGGLTATTGLTATGAGSIKACGSTIGGGVTIIGDTGLVTFGDTGSCAGNKISGNVKITGGSGGVKFFHNTVSGSLTITGNQQPVTFGNNTVSGSKTTSPNP